MGTVKLEKVEAGLKSEVLYAVKVADRVIGYISRYRNTRSNSHPWKAWAGETGAAFLGAYYGETSAQGKAGAVAAVVTHG